MRSSIGGVAHLSRAIEEDLKSKNTKLHKPHRNAIADLAASVITCRSVNTSEWKSIIPRENVQEKSKERYISNVLSNELIDPLLVMDPFVYEIAHKLSMNGEVIVLALDQSKISDERECLMVSLRFGNRALPVAWRVIDTKGEIGFDVQEPLLKAIKGMLPEGISVLLSADRFYGTSKLVGLCQEIGWDYRVRLKSNLIFYSDYYGEFKTGDLANQKINSVEDVCFNEKNIITNIGVLHEEGHNEPWIIAMNCSPSKYKVLDYGMRWGIECMFSDFKSRGFGITQTQIRHEDRIERLILILSVALYWAVSIGMAPNNETKNYTKKN